jgi:hypothetical protein
MASLDKASVREEIARLKADEHVDAEIKPCPACASTVKGLFPADMTGPLQYGHGLKAYLINLMVGQMMPLARTQSLTESLLGERISESTLFSRKTEARRAAAELIDLCAASRLKLVLTFPAGRASNGLSAQDYIEFGRGRFSMVEYLEEDSKFSILGGNAVRRDARIHCAEAIVTFTP